MNNADANSPEIDFAEIDKMVEERYGADKENLIMILQSVQERYNYLPRPALSYLSSKLKIPYSLIFGVATFYSSFSLEPRGRNIVSICLGTACHVRGGERIKETIHHTIEKLAGDPADMRFSVESVRCIGCCSLGPVVKINEDVHSRMTTDAVKNILDRYE
jgi:NADH:ubiquinone oxidoreductase subunit E